MATTTYYHTSPHPITSVTDRGLFGSCLFFSSDPYVMTASGTVYTYSVEVDENDIVDARSLPYEETEALELADIISQICAAADCDEDTAYELLSERMSAHDVDDIDIDSVDDLSFDLQRLAAEAAVLLGYCGVKLRDEQGSALLLDMLGRESELTLVD